MKGMSWGRWERAWWLLPAAVVLIAFRHAPSFGLLSDAAFLIDENLRLRGPGALWANLVHDYFWSSSGNSLPYWRPLTKGSWVIEQALGGGWPGLFHLVQLTWHLGGTLAVAWLARELGLSRGWAMAAALWYGLHPALIEPVSMVMARSDVACTTALVVALAAWLRWRGGAGARWAAVHGLALAAALASKETAVVLAPALTLVVALERLADRAVEPLTGRTAAGRWAWLRAVAPAWVLTILYMIGRRLVIGAGAAPGLDLDPLRWLVSAGRYFYGLFPLRIGSAIAPIPRDPRLDLLVPVTALLGWLFFGAAAVFVWRRARPALALGALLPLSLAPVLLVRQLNVPVAASRYALADRWALPAVAGAALVLAVIVAGLNRRALSVAVAALTGLWVVTTLALSGATHAPFRDTETLAAFQEQQYEALPERLRTLEDRCDHVERLLHQALRARAPEVAVARGAEVPPDCPQPGRFGLLRLIALNQLGRFTDAAAVAGQLEHQALEPRYHAQAAYQAGLAHLELGDHARAERELRQATRLGHPACNLPAQLGRLLAQRNDIAGAAAEYERASSCAPTDPRPAMAAATLWLSAGQRARAAAVLARVNPAALPPESRAMYDVLKRKVAP